MLRGTRGVFVVLFLIARVVFSKVDLSPQVALVNAFDLAKEAAIRDLDETERARILALLTSCDQDDPAVRGLTDLVAGAEPTHGSPDPYQRLRAGLRRIYDRLVAKYEDRKMVENGDLEEFRAL